MIARDMSETKEIEIKGAKFTIGLISAGTVRKLKALLKIGTQTLLRNQPMTEENMKNALQQPADIVFAADEKLFECFRGYVKHGVRSHTGITTSDDKEIPFKIEPGTGCVDEETMGLYENNHLMLDLGHAVLEFNNLSEEDKKKL